MQRRSFLALSALAPNLMRSQTAIAAPASHPLFDTDEVHEVRLTTQADWFTVMRANKETNSDVPYIQAAFQWRDVKYDVVGIRFKGNSSYNGAGNSRKKPVRIKFNEFTRGQKLQGMGGINFNNCWNDPSFVREKVYNETVAAVGLRVPRSSFAKLYINDEYLGLYGLGELINGDFLSSRFPGDDKGNLYQGDPRGTLEDLGDDPAKYKTEYEKESNEDADDWSDLMKLSQVLSRTPAAQLPDELAKLVDLDSVMRSFALDSLTVNLDNYYGMGHNFFLYRRLSDNRFVFLPWDPSLAFGALGPGLTTQQMIELPLTWTTAQRGAPGFPGGGGGGIMPPPGGGLPPGGGMPPGGGIPGGGPGGGGGEALSTSTARPLATKIFEVPALKRQYLRTYQQILNGPYNPIAISDRMHRLREIIYSAVEQDTQKLVTMAAFDNAMYSTATQPAPGQGGGVGGGFGGGTPGAAGFAAQRALYLYDEVPRQVLAAGA